jgi:hypothetical protein
MMIESRFTDVALDSITDYVLSVKAKKEQANVFECVKYVAEQLQYSINEVTHAFGDMIKKEVDRANAATDVIDESGETFSKSLLTEADANVEETQAKVDAAEKTQTTEKDINAQAAEDKKTNTSRRYFAFTNFNKGQIYICSEAKDAGNLVNKSLENLYNFLSTCEKPTFSNGILVAPITFATAKQYYTANKGKIKYLDLTPEKKAEQGQQQQTK